MTYLVTDVGGEINTLVVVVFLQNKKVNMEFVMHSIQPLTQLDYSIWYFYLKWFS